METRPTHVEQHYIPAFLLKQWHGVDNKLVQYSWTSRGFDIQSYTAKAVAKQPHLYSTRSHIGQPDVSMEKDYLGPKIDDVAAPVLYKLIDGDFSALDTATKLIWARFLIAQMVRVPSMLDKFRRFVSKEVMAGTKSISSQPNREGFTNYVTQNEPYISENIAIQMLPDVIESEKLQNALLKGSWACLSLRSSKFDLLIGDNPLIQVGPMSENFLIVLPVTPSILFCIASNPVTIDGMRKENQSSLVKTINKDSVVKSSTYVYSNDRIQTEFVKKYLKNVFRNTSNIRISP